jgi:hypothetical protein
MMVQVWLAAFTEDGEVSAPGYHRVQVEVYHGRLISPAKFPAVEEGSSWGWVRGYAAYDAPAGGEQVLPLRPFDRACDVSYSGNVLAILDAAWDVD